MRLETVKNIAAASRAKRRELEMTQLDLALKLGVSRKWVYDFEKGNPGAALGTVLHLCWVLGLNLEIADANVGFPGSTVLEAGDIDLDELLEGYEKG